MLLPTSELPVSYPAYPADDQPPRDERRRHDSDDPVHQLAQPHPPRRRLLPPRLVGDLHVDDHRVDQLAAVVAAGSQQPVLEG